MTEKEIIQEEQRIAKLNEYYLELFSPPDEDNEGRKEFDKMKGLILNLARCEAGLEQLHEALQESGGIVLRHPRNEKLLKPNPLNAEIVKQRAQMVNIMQMLERHLGSNADYEEDELNEFM